MIGGCRHRLRARSRAGVGMAPGRALAFPLADGAACQLIPREISRGLNDTSGHKKKAPRQGSFGDQPTKSTRHCRASWAWLTLLH